VSTALSAAALTQVMIEHHADIHAIFFSRYSGVVYLLLWKSFALWMMLLMLFDMSKVIFFLLSSHVRYINKDSRGLWERSEKMREKQNKFGTFLFGTYPHVPISICKKKL
jgi:hypothetical protein